MGRYKPSSSLPILLARARARAISEIQERQEAFRDIWAQSQEARDAQAVIVLSWLVAF